MGKEGDVLVLYKLQNYRDVPAQLSTGFMRKGLKLGVQNARFI